MSDTVLQLQIMPKVADQRFYYPQKIMKAPKISRVSVQQNFAHKGWNSCSAQFDFASDDSAYDIKSSSASCYKTSYKRLSNQESFPKKKPMLIEISNIESVFKEKKIQSPKRNTSQNYCDFKKSISEKERFSKNCFHKKLKSSALNLEDIKDAFQIKKQHIQESLKTSEDSIDLISDFSPDKINSHKKEHSNNWNKLRNLCETFINNSFNEINVSRNIDFRNVTKDSFIPVKVKSPKVQCTALSLRFIKDENETSINSSGKKCKDKNLNSNNLINVSNYDQINIPKEICISSQVPFVEKSETCISNYSSDLNADSNNLINDDSSPEQVKSPKMLCSSMSVASIQSIKKKNEALKFKSLNGNISSKNSVNNLYDLAISSKGTCTSISDLPPFVEENETFISKYSSDLSAGSNNIHEESSPVQVMSPKLICTPQSVVSFHQYEEGNEVLNLDQKFSLGGKSVVLENKTFMKSEMSFKDRCSSVNKGSSWVQSLKWSDSSLIKDATSESCDLNRKKMLRNIVQGGFSEQMLKLQRRERSDRVIWKHKMNELKKKAAATSVTFTLVSHTCVGKIILTRSYVSGKDSENIKDILFDVESEDSHLNTLLSVSDILEDSSYDKILQNLGWKPFIVLFKKDMFSKLHLKIKDMFALYPPWQLLSGTSLPVPVILCTYYVDILNKSLDIHNISSMVQPQPVIYYSLQSEEMECEEFKLSNCTLNNFLDLYGRCVCLSARVQRIWKNFILSDKIQDMLKIEFLGFSLLLQSKEGIFLELKINSSDLSPSYQEFLCHAEGHCFKFCDVVMSHRYNLHKCHELSTIIEFIQREKKSDAALLSTELYCCQFIPSSLSKIPSKISDENFPEYCDLEVKSLSIVQKNILNGFRVSCIGKVLFQNINDFYICDESLLGSKLQKYCKLKFSSLWEVNKQAIVGTSVLIKEAVINEGSLLVDKFSSCEIISNAKTSKLILSWEQRLKKIDLITNELVLSPLSLSSNVKDLVLVKGIIIHVDENSAISWLECSQCLKENLLEDSNSVIYCEDCSCIVSNPVLKVKMEVTIHTSDLSSAEIKIQLQSSTIKRILNIEEDNYNPQCNISDVIKKTTGVLSCYVTDIEIINKKKIFHLTEMISS